ncbi:MAG: DUF455 family protein [Acidobacteria bacterium]|nr:DUF455 family protein [Acidobacteriota bacterium]
MPEHLFGDEPARDERFHVEQRWINLANYANGDPKKEFEFFHRQMNEEINGLENSARCISDFPDVDWDLRMQLARQCSDEARHVVMFREIFERRGGEVGQFPIINFQYRIITRLDSLAARMAVQNRSFEADGLDAIRFALEEARESGDEELATLFDAQLADEINHVRFANQWIHILAKRNPAVVLSVARALTEAQQAFQSTMEGDTATVRYEVNDQVRKEAGFDENEVRLAREASIQRRVGGTS